MADLDLLLPRDLLSESWIELNSKGSIGIKVGDEYDELLSENMGDPEVVAIQRLLTLSRQSRVVSVLWDAGIYLRVSNSASIFPLLAVLFLLQGVKHHILNRLDNTMETIDVGAVVARIVAYRFAKDFFSDSEIVVCADGLGYGRPLDFYAGKLLGLRRREDVETLVADALDPHLGSFAKKDFYSNINALGVILAELFENTDTHAKLDLNGLPFKKDSIRGVSFKRIKYNIPYYSPGDKIPKEKLVECFEISVFDSGLGYFSSFMRQALLSAVDLDLEWKVVHNCLERHFYSDLPDKRPGHRAMGLYEVLRALQALKGRLEIRTGRVYGYRTFIEGEVQSMMQPKADGANFAWPLPKLLDMKRKYSPKPSMHVNLLGSAIRVIIPLA